MIKIVHIQFKGTMISRKIKEMIIEIFLRRNQEFNFLFDNISTTTNFDGLRAISRGTLYRLILRL